MTKTNNYKLNEVIKDNSSELEEKYNKYKNIDLCEATCIECNGIYISQIGENRFICLNTGKILYYFKDRNCLKDDLI